MEVVPWPTVISKRGIRRVRSRAAPRTSAMTLAVSPGWRLGERAGIQPVFVAKGKMEEEIFDGEDGLLGQSPGDSGAMPLTNWTGVSSVSTERLGYTGYGLRDRSQ